jgi:hypothetical protein
MILIMNKYFIRLSNIDIFIHNCKKSLFLKHIKTPEICL